MGQAQKKNYWRFTDNFLGKEEIIKRWKFLGKPRITPIHRWFSGRKPDATGPKLTFSGSNTHDWPGQPIQSSVCMQKIVIISHQSLKKNDIVKEKISLQDRSHYMYVCIAVSIGHHMIWVRLWFGSRPHQCQLPLPCQLITDPVASTHNSITA